MTQHHHILIVGTGDLSHGLCQMVKYNNTKDKDEYIIQVAESFQPKTDNYGKDFRNTGVPIVPLNDGINNADIIILAIPSFALKGFVQNNLLVSDTAASDSNSSCRISSCPIIIDCTNSSMCSTKSNLHDINKSLKDEDKVRWVKAFNDNGFEQLIHYKVTEKTRLVTKICGPNKNDVDIVKEVAEEAFGFQTKIVQYQFYEEFLKNHQSTVGTDWILATAVLLCIFLLTEVYALVRYNVKKGYSWSHLPLQVTNKAFCWTAIWGFALAQLPGIVAKLCNRFKTNEVLPLNTYLLWWLRIRKQIGLISLYFLVVHVLMSLLIFNPAYYGKFFLKSNNGEKSSLHTKFTQDAELSFFFGILGFSFYLILGIVSLPSVGLSMTHQQWKIMYGWLVWIALLFGFLHVLFMGYKGWTQQEKWPGNMPPITLMSLLLPMLAMALKLGQITLFIALDIATKLKNSKGRKIASTPSQMATSVAVASEEDVSESDMVLSA